MLGDSLRRLAEEIAASYESRIEGATQLKQETGELLRGFSEGRREMAQETHAELARFKDECQQDVAQLKKATQDFLQDVAGRQQEMKKAIRAELGEFRSNLAKYQEQRGQDAAQEIAARKGLIGHIKAETRAALTGFGDARQEMWKDLKAGLGDLMKEIREFPRGLANGEIERKKRVREELRDASEALRSRLSDLISDLVNEEKERKNQAQSDLQDIRAHLKTLFGNLREDLGRVLTDLDNAEQDRKRITQEELAEMSRQLRERLSAFQENISSTVSDFLRELKTSRSEEAAAWREILSAARGGTGVAQETEESFSPQREDLTENILDLLDERPEGLKMVAISEELGLSSWRSLIPVMRELLDQKEVRKEDSAYFIV